MSWLCLCFRFDLSPAFVGRTRSIATSKVHRLAYITVSSLQVFPFIFYSIHRPAQFDTLRSELDRLSVLFLGVEPSTANYTFIRKQPGSTFRYTLLYVLQLIVLLLSFMVHSTGWLFWVRREHMSANEFLLWLLCSFGFIMVLCAGGPAWPTVSKPATSIFPHFCWWASPCKSRHRNLMSRLVAAAVCGSKSRACASRGDVCFLALASLLKITNEPLQSLVTFHPTMNGWRCNGWKAVFETMRYGLGDARLGTLVDNYGGWSQSSI